MARKVTNQDIIWQFEKAAAVLEAQNANIFKIRAYQNAIETIQNLDRELSQMVDEKDIDDLPGIGKELSAKIKELLTTGQSKALEKLYAQVPAGMFPLLKIPGIGPKKAFRLATEFHLDSPEKAVSTLEKVAKHHQIRDLEGFGEKSEQLILDNLSRLKPKSQRMRLDKADQIAQNLVDSLSQIKLVKSVSILGSLRRRQDTIGDVDIGVATPDSNAVIGELKKLRPDLDFKVSGSNVIRCLLPNNKQADIKFQTPDKWGATLQHFTGSKLHNIALREYALKRGQSLSEHGIKSKGKLISYATESAFYAALDLEYIDPELRENQGEIAAAQQHKLPHIISPEAVLGDFHTHTEYQWVSSHDYGGSIKDLLNKANELGYQWLVVGDHNLSQTNYGPSEQITEIDKRNRWINAHFLRWKKTVKNSKLNVLSGLEVDILPEGELAITAKALDKLDIVIASIHSQLTQPRERITRRLLKAINQKPHIIGHPSGRLIPDRPMMDLDWEQIFTACAQNHVALEVNANPRRLDLPDSLIRLAIAKKVKLALGTDAHQTDHLDFMPYAVSVTRRGWAEAHDILNTLSLPQLKSWLSR